jgi:hypothetical protein
MCLFFFLLLSAAFPGWSRVCPARPSLEAYPLEDLLSCQTVANCLESYCDCVGGTLEATTGVCSGRLTLKSCDQPSLCLRRLFGTCLRSAAEQAGNAASAMWCDKWGSTAVNAFAEFVVSPKNYSETITYQSCASHLCTFYNSSLIAEYCVPNPAFACAAVLEAVNETVPGSVKIFGTISIPGTFGGINDASDVATLREGLSEDFLEAVPGAEVLSVVIASQMASSRSSAFEMFLILSFSIRIANNETVSVAAARALLASLGSTTAWLSATKTSLLAMVANATLGLPLVGFANNDLAAGARVTHETVCNTRCTVAIVVAAMVLVIVGLLVYFFLRDRSHSQVKPAESEM